MDENLGDTVKCKDCGRICRAPGDIAAAEKLMAFGEHPADDDAILCGECYEQFMRALNS
jgi:hypothetical protein